MQTIFDMQVITNVIIVVKPIDVSQGRVVLNEFTLDVFLPIEHFLDFLPFCCPLNFLCIADNSFSFVFSAAPLGTTSYCKVLLGITYYH